MQITIEKAKHAGEISRKFAWTDEELAMVISATELTVAFLEGKGKEWSLAIIPLERELESLRGFVRSRKRNR